MNVDDVPRKFKNITVIMAQFDPKQSEYKYKLCCEIERHQIIWACQLTLKRFGTCM